MSIFVSTEKPSSLMLIRHFCSFFCLVLGCLEKFRLCQCYKCPVKDAMTAYDCLSCRTTRWQTEKDKHSHHSGGSWLLRLQAVVETAIGQALWKTKVTQNWRHDQVTTRWGILNVHSNRVKVYNGTKMKSEKLLRKHLANMGEILW